MRNLRCGVVAAILWVWAAPASAPAQGLPPVNLGATSFLDGGPPAGPGLYFNQYLQFYTADRFLGGSGHVLPFPNPELTVWTPITQLIYLSKFELPLHAKPALDVLLPEAGINLDFTPNPGGLPRSNGFGLGDLLLGPAVQFDPIMGVDGPIFVHRLEAQFIIPTGKYSRDRELNPGAGFFSFDPYWAGTVFFTPKWTASYRAHYLWNAATHQPARSLGVDSVHPGEAFHINFTTDYEVLPKRLRVGLNGYYLRQTTDTEFDGIPVPGHKEQVLGLGPGLLYSFSQERHFFVNVYIESQAENRPEGVRLTLRYVQKF